LLEALNHPGIPRVYECGVLSDRRPWAAFQRVEGESLASAIANGPLPLVDVVLVLRDVADVLYHAHSRGVVHRRLTAESIVRTRDRQYSVCLTQWDHALTLDTEVKIALNTRDDVYALGAIIFRALTGIVPEGHVTTANHCPSVPSELASLLDCMLDPDPVTRPTAAEVRERARWLADTLEPLVPMDRPRWTPPQGVSDAVPVAQDDNSGFSIRISARTKSS
jgi:serine/threonine-protein kinase